MITKKKKDLVLFEINECDFNFFLRGSKIHNYPLIRKFFNGKKKINTFTKDKVEGFNLDPWVQWVSVHTGMNSSKHKVLRLGQKLHTKIPQIWEKLIKYKVNSTIWGLFNSNLRNKKNIDLFYPDPWSFTQSAYPKEFNSLLKLPKYYAGNYPNIDYSKIIYFSIIFFKKIFLSRAIFYILFNLHNFIKIFFFAKLKSFNLYFFLDLMSLEILKNSLNKKNSQFCAIALNSFAHYQHNYWDSTKFDKYYFWYLNEMIKKISSIEKNYNSSVCFNGFSQKRITKKYYIRAKNPKNFLKLLNIKFKKIEPNMTTGALIFFKNEDDKKKCISILKKICLNGKSLFNIQNYENDYKIFFKFNIFFYKKNFNFKNLNRYVDFLEKKKLKTYKNNYKLIQLILNNVIFRKSTSKHISNGSLYCNNFKIKNKKIENTLLFKHIINHFKK